MITWNQGNISALCYDQEINSSSFLINGVLVIPEDNITLHQVPWFYQSLTGLCLPLHWMNSKRSCCGKAVFCSIFACLLAACRCVIMRGDTLLPSQSKQRLFEGLVKSLYRLIHHSSAHTHLTAGESARPTSLWSAGGSSLLFEEVLFGITAGGGFCPLTSRNRNCVKKAAFLWSPFGWILTALSSSRFLPFRSIRLAFLFSPISTLCLKRLSDWTSICFQWFL